MTADEFLDDIVQRLDAANEADLEAVVSEIGCGDLENLIREDGVELWPRVEKLARANVRFRRALSSVWAYDSPEFDQRDALLRELGEHWPVTVKFVVEPEDFSPEPRLSWRAVEVDPPVPGGQLPRVLREIADAAERYGW